MLAASSSSSSPTGARARITPSSRPPSPLERLKRLSRIRSSRLPVPQGELRSQQLAQVLQGGRVLLDLVALLRRSSDARAADVGRSPHDRHLDQLGSGGLERGLDVCPRAPPRGRRARARRSARLGGDRRPAPDRPCWRRLAPGRAPPAGRRPRPGRPRCRPPGCRAGSPRCPRRGCRPGRRRSGCRRRARGTPPPARRRGSARYSPRRTLILSQSRSNRSCSAGVVSTTTTSSSAATPRKSAICGSPRPGL